MSSNPANTASVKRACDSCHRRKVKCIGEGTAPCKNCVSAALVCTYNAIPQKKGPKGSRAKVLSELRVNQRNAQLVTGIPSDLGIEGRIPSFAYNRTQGLLPAGLVDSCIDFFFNHVYPSEPVLDRQKLQEAARKMERSTEAYCLVVALCAFVILQANMEVPSSVALLPEMAQMSNASIGQTLLEESVRIRGAYDYRENPTHSTVLTSWLYYASYFSLAKENTAWVYLREATTETQILGMHDEETYKQDPLDLSRKRTLYWALFMAERENALQRHRPVSLYPTIHAPSLDEVPAERPIAIGFDIMINMFQVIDDTYINLWNRVHNHANPAWITRLQIRISEAVPVYLECTEAQAVLIRVTQQWLRVHAWQLCVCQGLVSNVSNDASLTLKYPIEASRELLTITHQFPPQAMEVHGASFIEKLFSIACCLIDVVACTSSSPDAFAIGPNDYVSGIMTLISNLHGVSSRYLSALINKISEVLPHFPLPRSLKFPDTMASSALGITAPESEAESLKIEEEPSATPIINFPTYSYPSTDLIRRLAAQTGTQLPFIMQQPLLSPPTTHVESLSIYDSPQSATQSSHSGHRSDTATPASFEPSLVPSGQQIAGHSSIQGPSPHAQHGHLQGHHVGPSSNTYDPRFTMQGYPADHDMTFK